jgi:calcium-dependent protein kinase
MRIFELLEDVDRYYIVSEYIRGGELYERIVKLKSFTEAKVAEIVYQLILALNYMHQNGIMHRDIKAENILMESKDPEDLRLKVTDFGFACFYTKGGPASQGD